MKKINLLLLLAFVAMQVSAQDKKMDAFINALMARMTLEEKIGQLNLITPGFGIPTGSVVSTDVEGKIKSGKVGGLFGVIGTEKVKQAQDIVMKESRLKIPLLFGSDVIHGHKTIFPIPIGVSCTWDTALIRQSAIVAASEATADGLNWAFSPMVDVARDPRWGRVSEGSGEDPFLGSQIVDGVPASGNKWLLTDLLKKDWKFNGMVVSDYTSINEMVNHRMGNLQEVSAMSIKAGLDMDMVGEGYLTTLKKSLDEKKITMQDIDRACRKVLEAKYKVGLFEDPYRYIDPVRGAKEVLSADKRAFARKIAGQSFVLLKNEKQTLPLKKSQKIALIGPLANDKNNMLGTWAVSGDPQMSTPVYNGMGKQVANGTQLVYAKGANITDDTLLAKRANVFGLRVDIDKRTPAAMIEEALSVANNADVVVAVLGEASEMSGEAASRSDINLPESQVKLLHALYATGKPVVVVLMSGRPLVLTNVIEGAASVLQVWHAGIEAGNAIADVLYGDVNPSGKLSMSFPYSVGQIPVYYSQKTTGRPMDPSNKFSTKYLDIPNEPLFPFGYGLSYSKFNYGDLKISSAKMNSTGSITASVTLTNAGQFDGAEVVQLYIEDKVRSITPPAKELKGFQKVYLKAGETKTVEFKITVEMLKFWNADIKFVAEPGEFNVLVGGNSRDLKAASFQLQ